MCIKAFFKELGRLAWGVGTYMPKGSNTIFFITRGKFPNEKMVTYGRIVSEIIPHNVEIHRVYLMVVGDRL